MIQIKIMLSRDIILLEEKINNFLVTLKENEFINIKFLEKTGDYYFVFVTYKKRNKNKFEKFF